MATLPASAQMRLTVEVLPLAEENSYGPYRDVALAAFKGRKFALPVQIDDTIERVWSKIEERYKKNYLTPIQAASFAIKVLQDAYDCDLDVGDTVRSLFEGEPDPAKRMIKVVPTFVYRDFSVPLTSNLRPASARKRQQEAQANDSTKRRRLEGQDHVQTSRRGVQHRVLPSTESDHSVEFARDTNGMAQTHSERKARRSKSGSVIQTGYAQTGGAEFASVLKDESPDLGEPSARTIPDLNLSSPHTSRIEKSTPLAASAVRTPRSSEKATSPSRTPIARRSQRSLNEDPTIGLTQQRLRAQDVEIEREEVEQAERMQDLDSVHQSPRSSSPEPTTVETAPLPVPRRSVYEVSPSPEFLQSPSKPKATYARNARPRRQQKSIEPRGTSRAPSPRVLIRHSPVKMRLANGTVGMARRFRFSDPDHIVSTPETNGANEANLSPDDHPELRESGPAESVTKNVQSNGTLEAAKPSKLKKPSQKSYNMPPPKEAPDRASPLGRPAARGRPRSVAKSRISAQSTSPKPTSTTAILAQLQRVKENILAKRRQSQGSQSADLSNGSSRHVSFSPTLTREQKISSPAPSHAQNEAEELQAQLDDEVNKETVAEVAEPSADEEDAPVVEKVPELPPLPWDSSASWDFGAVQGQDAIPQEEADGTPASKADNDVRLPPPSELRTTGEPDNEANAASRATSPSEVNSTRSSPPAVRQPARYLSHSPTPQQTDPDDDEGDEDEKGTAAPAKPESAATAVERETDTETSSSDSDTSTDSDEDIEMPDADADAPSPSIPEPPSSGPTLPSPTRAEIPIEPAVSLAAPRSSEIPPPGTTTTKTTTSTTISKTPIPLPGTTSSTTKTVTSTAISKTPIPLPSSQRLPSSQPQGSQSARRPRASQYTTLREQLNAAKAGSANVARRRTFDPSTQSLNLLKKAKVEVGEKKGADAKKALLVGGDDDSEEESSSSSESDSD
ncbi:uncharacterized protein EI97DRAFT_463199 [Westerdykella ornata]|uniref:Nucleolar protein Dnt1-like N-terminal domain-containing protein n=1 Tax=Westerdykella ornata TaxID=318751 RepID=A0A6A6JX17_WESOR|nr:uncharacterized protein EI97DRAFT_463199 [Westerdykella ornata]KAF2280744.1 hypothetical protein EI97DRAFT_463199 [Westerdykella ornata]